MTPTRNVTFSFASGAGAAKTAALILTITDCLGSEISRIALKPTATSIQVTLPVHPIYLATLTAYDALGAPCGIPATVNFAAPPAQPPPATLPNANLGNPTLGTPVLS